MGFAALLFAMAIAWLLMGFGAGYFVAGVFWLVTSWWWKSFNVWRGAVVILALDIAAFSYVLASIFRSNPFPETNYAIEMTISFGCFIAGALAFIGLNRSKLAKVT